MEKELKEKFRAIAESLHHRPGEHNRLCANMINAYWRERGFNANARVEEGRVVSDTLNGVPTTRIKA